MSSSLQTGVVPVVVADRLRREIIEGSLEPGKRVNVRRLGLRLDVSAIPIREALRLLEAEGFIEMIPNVGAVVAHVSRADLESVYELRRLIEPAIARRSVANMSIAHTVLLRNTLEELEAVERSTDDMSRSLISTHRQFHWELLAPGATRLVEDTIRRLWRISERYVALTRRKALPVADAQHLQMVELCEHRDGDGLADLIAHHLHLAADTVISLFDQNPDLPESTDA